MWNVRGVSTIASAVGRPLQLDPFTHRVCAGKESRFGYARVLVEVEATRDLCKEIKVAMPSRRATEEYVKTVGVGYPWKPLRCQRCTCFGHVENCCPATTPMLNPSVIPPRNVSASVRNMSVQGSNGQRSPSRGLIGSPKQGKMVWKPVPTNPTVEDLTEIKYFVPEVHYPKGWTTQAIEKDQQRIKESFLGTKSKECKGETLKDEAMPKGKEQARRKVLSKRVVALLAKPKQATKLELAGLTREERDDYFYDLAVHRGQVEGSSITSMMEHFKEGRFFASPSRWADARSSHYSEGSSEFEDDRDPYVEWGSDFG